MRTSERRSAARSLTIRGWASCWPTWPQRSPAHGPRTWTPRAGAIWVRPYSAQASVAKLVATDAAMKVTTDAVQVFGGVGYTRDYRVERYMREAKITQIFEGTNQIQRLVIARGLTTKLTGSGGEHHGYASRDAASGRKRQPDVAVGDVLRHDRGIEACSIVGDRQDDAVAPARQPDPDGGGRLAPCGSVAPRSRRPTPGTA